MLKPVLGPQHRSYSTVGVLEQKLVLISTSRQREQTAKETLKFDKSIIITRVIQSLHTRTHPHTPAELVFACNALENV